MAVSCRYFYQLTMSMPFPRNEMLLSKKIGFLVKKSSAFRKWIDGKVIFTKKLCFGTKHNCVNLFVDLIIFDSPSSNSENGS